MKRLIQKLFIIPILLAVLLGILARPLCISASGGSNAISAARSGVMRVVVTMDISIGGEYIDTDLYRGSAFGVGEKGKETDIFVTNRHVVKAPDAQIMRRIDAFVEVYGMEWIQKAAEGVTPLPSGLQKIYSYTEGELTEYVKLEYRRARIYLLLDDYAYSNSEGLDTSRTVPCSVRYEAGENEPDLAVLQAAEKVTGRVALPLMPAEDGGIEEGDVVYALGYPVSADAATTDSYNSTNYAGSVESVSITSGIASRIINYTTANARIIQHDAAINGGNSGGPLLNKKGAVVGVNTLSFNATGVDNPTSTNHSGAIASEHVIKLLDNLGIKYSLYSSGPGWVMIAIVAAAAAGAAAVVTVTVKKRKPAPVAPVIDREENIPEPGPSPQGADSGLRIQCLSGAFAGRRFAVNGQVRIGHDPQRNDLVYPAGAKGVSGVHCAVIEQNGQIYLKDLGSTYGTWLAGGQRLAANQPVQLKVGDRFWLGSEQELFQITGRGGSL